VSLRALPLLAACVLVAPGAARASPLVYAALGDSTAVGVGADQGGGYPERIARRLVASGVAVKLLNLGAQGATAADLRRTQLPRLLSEHPGLVTIGVGLDDAVAGRPLAEFARDLQVLADLVARTKAPVVVSELPDVSLSPARTGSARALARRIAAYNAVIREVTERYGFLVADVEAPSRRAQREGAELFSRDGLHPSTRGYEVWAGAMWPAVERALAPRAQGRRTPQGER
jgi:acyl-CoA thioesterase-1